MLKTKKKNFATKSRRFCWSFLDIYRLDPNFSEDEKSEKECQKIDEKIELEERIQLSGFHKHRNLSG